MEKEDMDNMVAVSEWKGYWESLINENTALREELAAYKAMLFQAQTERDVARATVCISPWEDSPPCRGIQKQLDKIDAMEIGHDRLIEAVTPSTATKAAYMGEFSMRIPEIDEDGNEYMCNVNVPWTTIKEIMKAIAARANVDKLLGDTK